MQGEVVENEFLHGASVITITVLPYGMVRLRSTCLGSADSSYAPLRDERLVSEIPKLLAEIREREAGQVWVVGSDSAAQGVVNV